VKDVSLGTCFFIARLFHHTASDIVLCKTAIRSRAHLDADRHIVHDVIVVTCADINI
jgi:hypothetical protein